MNDFLRTILFLPEQRSTLAPEIDGLHYFVILVTMAGAVGVALFAAYYLVRYRQSAHRGGFRPPDPDSHHSPGGVPYWFEGFVIVGLLGLFVMWWVIGFRQYVRIQMPPKGSIDVYVSAKKWMWTFVHPDGSASNTVLYVPTNRPVKLVMTSRDVIHSFFVPEFRIKQDLVPGRITTAWFEVTEPGTYPILCTEYCGAGHSTMRGQVVALSPGDYEQHLDQAEPLDRMRQPAGYQEPGLPENIPGEWLSLADMGERVAADKGCLRCHTVDGTPHIGPTWARVYDSLVSLQNGETIVADEAYLTESMMDPLAKLRVGFEPVMPSYQGLLTASETGALVEYIKRLRSVPVGAPESPLPRGQGDSVQIEIPATGAERTGQPGREETE